MLMTQDEKRSLYIQLSKNMQEDLKQIKLHDEPAMELEIVKSYCLHWNKIINVSCKWNKEACEKLKHSPFLGRFYYDVKKETLEQGRIILKRIKSYHFKDTKARKKQSDFINELEDRLHFISSRFINNQ